MSPSGHFAVGLAAKRVAPKAPLGILLLATLVIDLLCFVFLFAGIERSSEQIELSYIPWSHGLAMAIVWPVAAGVITFLISQDRRTSVVIGLVVLSHWVLDFIGHDPDLPLLFDNSPSDGLSIEWTHTPAGLVVHWVQALVTEFGLLTGGLVIYWITRNRLTTRI